MMMRRTREVCSLVEPSFSIVTTTISISLRKIMTKVGMTIIK